MEPYTVSNYLLHGILSPTVLSLFIYTCITSLLTLLATSCYLHRSQSHRSVYFIAPINHFFRLILWLFTGMNTKEWVSVHRKHHAKCDTPEDPHSPRYFGIKKILLEGADIYTKAGQDKDLLNEYGDGTPHDWLERTVYGAQRKLGIGITLTVELILFGLPALIIWSIQMLVIPIIAAGFINGIAHVWGYQRYKDGELRDDGKVFKRIGGALNVPTYGLAVGEEFHNNHHAYMDRYKFSHAWYEFDLSGTIIELLTWIGFAWVPRNKKSTRIPDVV